MVNKNTYLVLSIILLTVILYLGWITASNDKVVAGYVRGITPANGKLIVTVETKDSVPYEKVSLIYALDDGELCGFSGRVISGKANNGWYSYRISINPEWRKCGNPPFDAYYTPFIMLHSSITIVRNDASNTQIAGVFALGALFTVSTVKWLSEGGEEE